MSRRRGCDRSHVAIRALVRDVAGMQPRSAWRNHYAPGLLPQLREGHARSEERTIVATRTPVGKGTYNN